jgi:biopolymer transport protein ExbD/biopolymer transport protein TolR
MGMKVGGRKKVKVQPDMNVTPLVDVVLVLLIIFMVLAPVMTEAFNVRLPPKDDKDEQLDQVNDPTQPLVLSVDADGGFDVNGVELEREEVAERLHRMFNARTDNVLYLDGHDDVHYGLVVVALDEARKGGARPVVMITKKLE